VFLLDLREDRSQWY